MNTSAEQRIRAVSIALGVVFLLTGAIQILDVPWVMQRFQAWHYTQVFRRLVGAVELLGALALFSPRTTSTGSILLGAVMLGGIYTHLFRGNPLFALAPGAMLATLLYVGSRQLDRAGEISPRRRRFQRAAFR